MNPFRKSLVAAAALATALVATSFGAHAQATRTWVSGVGDDVNPCSRTAPCKTFAGAISKTATNGEISVLDPGGFGTVTITKSITISGDGTLAGILSAGTNGVIVNCISEPACTVTLRSVSINGAGTGINGVRFLAGGKLHMDNVTIESITGQGVDFQPSGNAYLYMHNVQIREATGGAVLIKPSGVGTANASITSVMMDASGRGLRVEDRSVVAIRDSRAMGNVANGFVAIATAGGQVGLTVENCLAQSNGATGIYSGAGATVYMSNTTVTSNLDGLQAAGGGIISLGGNRVYSNLSTNGAPTSSIPTL